MRISPWHQATQHYTRPSFCGANCRNQCHNLAGSWTQMQKHKGAGMNLKARGLVFTNCPKAPHWAGRKGVQPCCSIRLKPSAILTKTHLIWSPFTVSKCFLMTEKQTALCVEALYDGVVDCDMFSVFFMSVLLLLIFARTSFQSQWDWNKRKKNKKQALTKSS